MKKFLMRLACMILAITMVLSFVACDKEEAEETEKVEEVEEVEKVEEVKEPTPEEKAVAEYVSANRDEAVASGSNEYGETDIKAEGTVVVFMYTYKDIDETPDGMKEALDEALDSDEAEQTLENIKSEESAVTGIRFEYYESDGDLITSKEFK